jgi:hypothetical protein
MRSILPVVLLGLAGLLVGGALSLRRQGARWPVVAGMGLLGALAAAAGLFWLAQS